MGPWQPILEMASLPTAGSLEQDCPFGPFHPKPGRNSMVIPQPRPGETHGKTSMCHVDGLPFQRQEQSRAAQTRKNLNLRVAQEPGFSWRFLTHTAATGKASLVIPTNKIGKTIRNEKHSLNKGREAVGPAHRSQWHTLLAGRNGAGIRDQGSRHKALCSVI